MPASYTHQSIATDTLYRMDLFFKGFSLNAFLAGAEGPDPLFFSLFKVKGESPLPEIGHLIHKSHTGEFLDVLVNRAKGDPLLMSFTLGFITHYAADTVFHPFIYTRSFMKDGTYNGNKHCKFEHILDVYIYREKGHARGLPVQMSGYYGLDKGAKKRIAALLTETIKEVFPDKTITEKSVEKSFSFSVNFCNILRMEALKKASLIMGIVNMTPIKGLADSHLLVNDTLEHFNEPDYSTRYYTWDSINTPEGTTWHSYWEPEKERTEGIDELYAEAVDRSEELMMALLEYMQPEETRFAEGKTLRRLTEGTMKAIIGDNSYDSGLPWQETPSIETFNKDIQ